MERAATEFRSILETDPDNGRTQNDLGSALLRLGRPAEDVEHFNRASLLYPKVHQIRRNLGLALFRSGNHSEAIEPLEEYLAKEPDDDGTRQMLGACYSLDGQFQRAVAELEPLSQRGMTDPSVKFPLASSYVRLGEMERAEHVLESMFRDSPDSPELRLLLAQVLEARQQGERALGELDRTLSVLFPVVRMRVAAPRKTGVDRVQVHSCRNASHSSSSGCSGQIPGALALCPGTGHSACLRHRKRPLPPVP